MTTKTQAEVTVELFLQQQANALVAQALEKVDKNSLQAVAEKVITENLKTSFSDANERQWSVRHAFHNAISKAAQDYLTDEFKKSLQEEVSKSFEHIKVEIPQMVREIVLQKLRELRVEVSVPTKGLY